MTTETKADKLVLTFEKYVEKISQIKLTEQPLDHYMFRADLHGHRIGEIYLDEDGPELIPDNTSYNMDDLEAIMRAFEAIEEFKSLHPQFHFKRVYDEGVEQYANSSELAEIYAPYADSELERHLDMFRERGCEFIAAYVVDPVNRKHVGTTSNMLLLYRSAEGLLFLREVSAGAMLTARDWKVAQLFNDGIRVTDITVEKTDENRERYKGSDVILTGISI